MGIEKPPFWTDFELSLRLLALIKIEQIYFFIKLDTVAFKI